MRCSCGVPCVAVGGAPPTISLVTTHYAEPFGWLKPVLSRHERLDVVIYERCSSLNAPSLAAAHRFRGPFGAALESPRCADAICRVGLCLQQRSESSRPAEAPEATTFSTPEHASGCLGRSATWAAALAGPCSDLGCRHRCGVSALPAGLRSHPRVRLRDKGGALAQRDPFFSFFDHVVQSYRAPLGGKP